MWLLLAFIGVPLIEIALFIQIGGLIGLWPTLLIVVLTAILGTYLVRSQGALALSELRSSFNDLRDPTEPLAHGAMILFAGALLLTPGFFTDALGFALLTPPFRRVALAYARKHVKVQRFEMGERPRGPAGDDPQYRPRPEDEVIDADYVDLDADKRPTHPGNSGWTKH